MVVWADEKERLRRYDMSVRCLMFRWQEKRLDLMRHALEAISGSVTSISKARFRARTVLERIQKMFDGEFTKGSGQLAKEFRIWYEADKKDESL